jgi:hypothetical protein
MSPPNDAFSPLPVSYPLTHATTAEPLWYKDTIIYQLHVKAFFDTDDDGIGDFEGLRRKLDYLQDLGATALWLLPFYPSPSRDGGYDIADTRASIPRSAVWRISKPLSARRPHSARDAGLARG